MLREEHLKKNNALDTKSECSLRQSTNCQIHSACPVSVWPQTPPSALPHFCSLLSFLAPYLRPHSCLPHRQPTPITPSLGIHTRWFRGRRSGSQDIHVQPAATEPRKETQCPIHSPSLPLQHPTASGQHPLSGPRSLLCCLQHRLAGSKNPGMSSPLRLLSCWINKQLPLPQMGTTLRYVLYTDPRVPQGN